MAQDFDKIIKEDLSKSIPFLAKTILGLKLEKTQLQQVELKLQYTIEREPDFLKRVETGNPKNDYVLQIEFQTADKKKEMLHRTGIYKFLIMRREGLLVKQFVFFIGDKKPAMQTEYKDEDSFHRYHLIDFKTIDSEPFLNSSKPEEVIFAILADFKRKHPETFIRDIAKRLKEICEGQLELEKYSRQLEILSKLRNLQKTTIKILKAMPIFYDLKTDIRFLQGKEEGIKEGKEEGIKEGKEEGIKEGKEEGIKEAREKELRRVKSIVATLLAETDFSPKKIAHFAGVSLDFVKKTKKELEAGKKKQNGKSPSNNDKD